ncbi:Alpha/Beta hydrolase protein [Desarmillaria tabescens]|uniref:Alpha/Beta hydrolase protein n=1 Tax=Armillaria tabescens TaxID=1929756 RepID=A0AA39K1F4_ARMTA|nr:Alpha/Beta hydrolase protein [Desarmillaria tabescens]KAK0450418.1 Alpha/Beta hydrolase protein [Desarmillaria tabescens]
MVTSIISRTNSGPVEGFVDTHPVSEYSSATRNLGPLSPIKKWLGIPYAQAQRWQRAQPPTPWTEPLQCFEFGPSFPQPISAFDEMYAGRKGWFNRDFLGQSEDAFSLNVFAPATEGYSKVPVMVWVYGGNLNTGSSNMPIYDPSEFVRAQASSETPCVVVTGNYRLNAFGWLATKDLAEINGHVGNFGLHDVIAIFEWVRANIMEFGGDSNNVTAFGESAGAFLLGTLLKSRRRLFHRLILQSGGYGLMGVNQKPNFAPYDELLAQIDPKLTSLSAGDRINRLKTIPTAELLNATQAFYHTGIWCLTCDPNEPGWASSVWDLVNKGDYDPWIESIIIGINRDEGTFFNHRSQFWIRENAMKMIKDRRGFDDEVCTRLLDMYPPEYAAPDLSDLRSLPSTMVYSDSCYLMPMLHAGSKLTTVPNLRTGKLARVYMYLCHTLPSRLLEGYEHFGVLHTGEIPFIFKRSSLWEGLDNGKDAKTSNIFGRFWSSFATSGSPGNDWPMFTKDGGEILIFSDGGKVSVGNAWEIRPAECQAWMNAAEKSITSGSKETLADQ